MTVALYQPRGVRGLALGATLVPLGALAILCCGPMLVGPTGSLFGALHLAEWLGMPLGAGVQALALAVFATVFVAVVACGLPGASLLMLAAGVSLGVSWGVALCCVAAMLGAGLPLIALRGGWQAGSQRWRGIVEALRDASTAERLRMLFALRLALPLRDMALAAPARYAGVGASRMVAFGALALVVTAAAYANAGAELARLQSPTEFWSESLLLALAAALLLPRTMRLVFRAVGEATAANASTDTRTDARTDAQSMSFDAAVPAGVPGLRHGAERSVASERRRASIELRRALLLFTDERDDEGFERSAGRYRFDRAGFDLFSFPSNTRVARFDIERFVDRLARRSDARDWHAVVSAHEQFGALCAALLTERLGLPGPSPEAVIAAQHKLHARRVLDRVAPEANVRYALLDCEYGEPVPADIRYPVFVKPVKAAFSVLARRVDSREALQALTRFGPFEAWTIRHLVEPFERVARRRLPLAGSAHRMLLEESIDAPQYNLDGYVHRGEVHAIGIVDPEMYPGTQAFMRWDCPSRLAPAVQARALDVARRFLTAIGFDQGMFNMEFFHDPRTDRLAVIEFNPRMSSQPADLYRRVLGVDMHAMALALAEGVDPARVPRHEPRGAVAASFVFRSFDARRRPAMPSAAVRAALARRFPGSLLIAYPRTRQGIERDLKWLGSHRYALLHLEGESETDLRERCLEACELLGWPAPYADRVDGLVTPEGTDAERSAQCRADREPIRIR